MLGPQVNRRAGRCILKSSGKPSDENSEVINRQLEMVQAVAKEYMLGRTQKAREWRVKGGKLLHLDWVQGLLDPGTPFLEVGLFAANNVFETDIPSAGVVTGIGKVHSRCRRGDLTC